MRFRSRLVLITIFLGLTLLSITIRYTQLAQYEFETYYWEPSTRGPMLNLIIRKHPRHEDDVASNTTTNCASVPSKDGNHGNKHVVAVPPQSWLLQKFGKSSQRDKSTDSPRTKCSHTYFFPKIGIVFTDIPQNGGSRFLEALVNAEESTEDVQLKSKVEEGGNHTEPPTKEDGVITTPQTKDSESVNTKRDSEFKFVVIRNPWTRMVSGYIDEIAGDESGNLSTIILETARGDESGNLSSSILETVRGDEDTDGAEDLLPTFAEFLQWLASPEGSGEHRFRPQIELMCEEYDFVIPLEHATTLRRELWDGMGLDIRLFRLFDIPKDPVDDSAALEAKEWISDLDQGLIDKVYKRFEADFDLANYTNVTHPNFPLPLYHND